MKIIDAVWEERNIGVKTFEINIEDKDIFETFENKEKEVLDKGAKYIVVKTPVNMPDFIWGLQKNGYTFIEMAFSLSLKQDKYFVSPLIARLDRGITVAKVENKDEIEKLLENFKDDIFDTDRISVDPLFKKGSSANRYILWTRDMIASGSTLYNVKLNEKDIGFFIIKKIDDTTGYPVLAGLFNEYKGKGLGSLLIKKCIDQVWELGFKKLSTILVSNNLEIIKIDLNFGFQIETCFNVYVKHVIDN